MAEVVTTWPAAAVIGAVVSLVVVTVNVASARIARREDREEKRREWLREKRVRDIEEIVLTLGRFVEEIAGLAEDIDATQSIINDHLHWELKNRAEHADDESWVFAGKQELVRWSEESGDDLQKGSGKMNNLAFVRQPWFAYGTKRLTLWLDSRAETWHSLDVVGEELNDFCLKVLKLADKAGSFYKALSRRGGELTEADVEESDTLRQQLEAELATREQMEIRVVALQESLADKLKADVLPISAPVEGGPVVWLAQRLENGVRWFLRS